MTFLSAWASAYLPDTDNVAFQVNFDGKPCDVAVSFHLRLHQRLEFELKAANQPSQFCCAKKIIHCQVNAPSRLLLLQR